ncbi:MAG TPA: enolase C-terminal domain-like protein, partial [Microvirga sp.]|nr:enolase C-terminal domain-like protein [Microvirga sp.]
MNVTVPAISPEAAHALVEAAGCSTAKVKVGDPEDEARVEAVRDALGPRGRIRVDVNGAWDVERATVKLRTLGRFGLEYAEQ